MNTTNVGVGMPQMVEKARKSVVDLLERAALALRSRIQRAPNPYTHVGSGREHGCPPVALTADQAAELDRARGQRHGAHRSA